MFAKYLYLCLILLIVESCNYRFMVEKDKIIYDKNGFVLMVENSLIFVESNDSSLKFEKILKNINENTFQLNNLEEQKIYAFKGISNSIVIKTLDPFDQITLYTDTIYYAYMKIMGKPTTSTFAKIPSSDKYFSFIYNKATYNIYFNYFKYGLYYFYPENKILMDKFVKKLYEYNDMFE